MSVRNVSLHRSTGWVVTGVAVGAVSGALALILLARYMPSSSFVALAALTPVVSVISVIGRFGFDRLAVRHYWLADAGVRARVVLRYVLAGIGATALLAVAVVVAGHAYNGVLPTWTHVDAASAALVIVWCVGESARFVTQDLPRSWGRDMAATCLGTGGRNVLWLVAVIVCAHATDQVTLATGIATAAVPSLLVGAIGVLYVARRARLEALAGRAAAHIGRIDRRVVRSGLSVAALLVTWILIGQFDVVVVSGAFSSDTAADYAVASRIAATFGLSLVALTGLLPSMLGRLGLITDDHEDPAQREALRQLMALVTTCACAASLLAIVAFAVAGGPVLDNVLGADFAAAYGLTLVLLLGQVVNVVTGATATLLIVLGEERHVARVGIVVACTAMVIEIAAATQGVYWVACASAAAVALPNIVYTRRLQREFGFTALPSLRVHTLRAGLALLRGPDLAAGIDLRVETGALAPVSTRSSAT